MAELRPDAPLVARVEIGSSLYVDVRKDSLPEGYGERSCWTFYTEGLDAFGQQEVVFSMVTGRSDPDPPAEPIKFLRTLAGEATRGNIVGSGGRTRFGEDGLFGDLTGIGYVSISPWLGLRAPRDALLALFLLPIEVDVVEAISLSRVLARLGQAYRFFPFPWWSDPSRKPVVDRSWITASIISRVRSAPVPGCATVFTDNRLIITCSRSASARFEKLFSSIAREDAVAFLTEPDPLADAHLVWEPGQTEPTAISPPGSQGRFVSGSFLLFLPSQSEDGARLHEDGFVLWLTTGTAAALREAFVEGRNFQIRRMGQLADIELRWT